MCENCIHRKVCKHRRDLEILMQDLLEKEKHEGLPIAWEVKCKFYTKDEEF